VSRQESGLPRCRRMTPPFNLTEIPQWTTLGCPSASYRTRKNQLAQLNLAAVSGSPSQGFFRLFRFFRRHSPVPLPHGMARDGKATSRTRFDRPQDTRHERRGPVDPHPSAVASTQSDEPVGSRCHPHRAENAALSARPSGPISRKAATARGRLFCCATFRFEK